MLNVETLPDIRSPGRLIIIGDVHGCPKELDALLLKANFNQKQDQVLFVGDLVNKGYDSAGVVKRAMEINAKCVLGNHDVTLIHRVDQYREGLLDPSTTDPIDLAAMSFPKDCYDYLTALPHIMKVPQFKLIVVHAGLNPKCPQLEAQNLWEILHMRRVLSNGRVIDAHSGGEMWASKWRGPETIVFGHDARKGFQKHPYAIGLDTGCCYGAELTALVLPGGDLIKVPGSIVPVQRKTNKDTLRQQTPSSTPPTVQRPSPGVMDSAFASPPVMPTTPPQGPTPTSASASPQPRFTTGSVTPPTAQREGRSTEPSVVAAPKAAAIAATVSSNKNKSNDDGSVMQLAHHILKNAAKLSSNQAVCLSLLSDGPMESLRDDLLEDSSISASTWCDLISALIQGLPFGTRGDDALSWVEDIVLARSDVLGTLEREKLLSLIDANAPNSNQRGLTAGSMKSVRVALR